MPRQLNRRGLDNDYTWMLTIENNCNGGEYNQNGVLYMRGLQDTLSIYNPIKTQLSRLPCIKENDDDKSSGYQFTMEELKSMFSFFRKNHGQYYYIGQDDKKGQKLHPIGIRVSLKKMDLKDMTELNEKRKEHNNNNNQMVRARG